MLRTILMERGHQVAIAHTGEEALAAALSFRPQVGLLDIGMPDLSGYEVASALRRHPETTAAFLVAITGWGQEDDRRRALASGFDAHLTKPADPDELLALVAERFREAG
jgi:CheY-like chemotaxis protein